MRNPYFSFKQFTIHHDRCAMKVGTDGVLLGAWAPGGSNILDIGTGTGLVALMMAQRFSHATVTGIEIDREAAMQATENADASPFCQRVKIEPVSLQDFSGHEGAFDAITCNPPFFEESLKCPDGSRSTARHTDSLPYSTLINSARRLLSADGTLSIIIPTDYLAKVEQECAFASMFISQRVFIRTTQRKQPKRILLAITKTRRQDATSSTVDLMNGNERSEWYQELTKEFYLK